MLEIDVVDVVGGDICILMETFEFIALARARCTACDNRRLPP